MNILIEDAETREYLSANGKWTKSATSGKSFRATAVAMEAAQKEPINDFNIIFYIPQTQQIVNLDNGRGTGLVAKPA